MAVNTTWSSPATASGSGGTDLAAGDTLSETVWDRLQSDVYRLGGTDGNAKTGKYQLGSGAGTTYSNASNAGGLTVHQGADDDEALSLKSSDVAHGITAITETDTYGYASKVTAASGGARLVGLSEATTGLGLDGYHTTDDTTKTTSSAAAVVVDTWLKSGTSRVAPGANANTVAFRAGGTTRHILDAEGDSHQDTGTAWTNFSDHDDVGLLNLLSAHVTKKEDPLRARFSEWLERSRAPLEENRIVTFNDDGHHFINWSRTHMLVIGAIIQLGGRLAQLEERLVSLPSPRD